MSMSGLIAAHLVRQNYEDSEGRAQMASDESRSCDDLRKPVVGLHLTQFILPLRKSSRTSCASFMQEHQSFNFVAQYASLWFRKGQSSTSCKSCTSAVRNSVAEGLHLQFMADLIDRCLLRHGRLQVCRTLGCMCYQPFCRNWERRRSMAGFWIY